MGVALRGALQTGTGTTGTVVLNAPTGLVAGDVIIIWVAETGSLTTTFASTGFTALNTPGGAGTDAASLLWRTADGTEGTTFSVTNSGAGLANTAMVLGAFSGAAGGPSFWDPGTPAAAKSVSGSVQAISIAGLENSASEATVVNGDMILWLVAILTITPTATTIPSGFTGTSTAASSATLATLAYKPQTTAGTVGTQAGSINGTTVFDWNGQMVALRAATPPLSKQPLKPLIPVIDWNNPITRGLVFDCPLFERGGVVANDLAQKRKGTIVNLGTAGWQTGVQGANLAFNASGASSVDFTTLANTNSQTSLSFESLWLSTGLGGSSVGRLWAKGNTTNAYFLAFMQSATLMELWAGWATTQGNWTIPITENTWHHMVLTYNFGSTANNPLVYLDGLPVTVTRTATPAGATPSDDANFSIGNRLDHTRTWAGNIAYTRIWNRILNISEVTDLAVNPWVIYDPHVRGNNL